MLEQNIIKAHIKREITILVIFLIIAIFMIVGTSLQSGFSFSILLGGIQLSGLFTIFANILIVLIKDSEFNFLGSWIITGVSAIGVLLVLDFICNATGISDEILISVVGIGFIVIRIIQLIVDIKNYKTVVKQEANLEKNSSDQDENEWLLK